MLPCEFPHDSSSLLPPSHHHRLHQVEGLDAGGRYLVRARAANTCGWGAWTEALPCSTSPDVPAAPGGLQAKATGTTVRASWGVADDNGSPVLSYELEVAGGSSGRWASAFRGDATTHRLQQLQPNTLYQLRVRAVNAGGWGLLGVVAAQLSGEKAA